MTTLERDGTRIAAPRALRLGVRVRLLLAFFGIAAFTVIAAGAGIYAFREVGNRLHVVESRAPPALSALELSRSAERIIAVAPALLASTDRMRRDEIKAELAVEVQHLDGRLLELKRGRPQALLSESIERVVSSLTASLGELDGLVARRLETSERIRMLRDGVFRARDETQRLLGPWLEVVGSEIADLSEEVEASQAGITDPPRRLTSMIAQQRLLESAQRESSAIADMLAEASIAQSPDRLRILEFQIGLALQRLEAMGAELDPRLRPLLLERVASLHRIADGPDSIIHARRSELALVESGARRLAETAALSAQLTAAVDKLGTAARQDIGEAISDALSVQRVSTRALIAVGALSFVTSGLIVWLYVGGNIVRRLTALSDGMLAIAGGRLGTSVVVRGGDEIAAMGRAVETFRRNAIELERLLEERKETAERLERLVEERTRDLSDKSRQLEIANRFKSHFLASASHDLRQPLHALNLFVAQLHAERLPAERHRLVGRIEAAVSSMNELFEQLLDMSKLEAGIIEPHLARFPIGRALKQIETTFTDAARQKGLRLSVVPSSAWVRSDLVLLERILMNLVSNAVRYTTRGGVVIGCRRRGGRLRIDVYDSGPGIPEEQQQSIFGEYRRLAVSGQDRDGGLGLGLAIVERLGRLLHHEIAVVSRPGRGSRFSVSVPLVAEQGGAAEAASSPEMIDPLRDKLVLVIDDDPLVLEGMGGILRSWGCRLLTAQSQDEALAGVAAQGQRPDLVISDYRLADGATGIQVIERLRRKLGVALPALLISGDTAPERLRDAGERGIELLHKPVSPMQLRAVLNPLLRPRHGAGVGTPRDR